MNGLYKGKRIDNGEWVEGFYWAKLDPCTLDNSFCNHFIHNGFVFEDKIEVDPKTVSQATGYRMKNKKVFYGDLVSNNFGTDKEVIREVVDNGGCKMLKRVKGDSRLPKYILLHDYVGSNFKIIGNIHDK